MALLFLPILQAVTNPASAAEACPDLSVYYPAEDSNVILLERELARLTPQCLLSPEFFALQGALLLDMGQTDRALESLERALLLDPDYGAAQIDYAQALFLQGQLFPALDMNQLVLEREDLPEDLATLMALRHQVWTEQTHQRSVQADVLAGYDSNLNGGPDSSRITLTLSGEPINLELSEDYQPINGAYATMRLAGRVTQLAPNSSDNWLGEVRGRLSEHRESDLLQFDTRYIHVKQTRTHDWQYTAGVSHLMFGGESLYTATEGGIRYLSSRDLLCRPFAGLTAQYQKYHANGNKLTAIETKSSAGLDCTGGLAPDGHHLSAEVSRLNNFASYVDRPGGDRRGWQASLQWDFPLYRGVFSTQFGHTELDDTAGYSEFLQGGATRYQNRSYALLQYRQSISQKLVILANLFHQNQRSNIELFDTSDTTFEVGASLMF